MKTKKFVFILLLIFIAICASIGNADDFDWPRWCGPNGDGISMETDWDPEALTGGPKILWKVDKGMSHLNVVIKSNRLYTMGFKNKETIVYCLKPKTGEEIWGYPFKTRSDPQSTPTTDGKFVYALSKEGILLGLKAKNGKILWEKKLKKIMKLKFLGMGLQHRL